MSKSPSIQCISQIFSKKSPDITSGTSSIQTLQYFPIYCLNYFRFSKYLDLPPRHLSSFLILQIQTLFHMLSLCSALICNQAFENVMAPQICMHAKLYIPCIYSFRFSHLGMPLLTNFAGFLHLNN